MEGVFILKSIIDAIRSAFSLKEATIVQDLLTEVIKFEKAPLPGILDLIIELLANDNFFFMNKIYPVIIERFEHYNNINLVEFDKYILMNSCFLDNEKILDMTNGLLKDNYSKTLGRIYLTNFRIIACGKREYLKSINQNNIINHAIANIATSHQNKQNLLEWGYYYPIFETFKSEKTEDFFTYSFKVPIENDEKEIRVMIRPKRSKDLKGKMYIIKRKNFLNLLRDLVLFQKYPGMGSQKIQEVQPVSKSPIMKISGEIIKTTETALLIKFRDKEVWIPRSIPQASFEEVINKIQIFELPIWLVRRHQLI